MRVRLTGISSMATRSLLAELAAAYRQRSGVEVDFESVGGVDAARRVQSGEAFDVVVLAREALAALADAGRVIAASRVDLARSGVAIAIRAGAARPDVGTADALRDAVRTAHTIGYSTGPSGAALLQLFERWGIAGAVRDRLVQAPSGVPVGTLVADGAAEIGFQQLSELMNLPGIDVLGPMPAGAEIDTTFSAGVSAAAKQPGTAGELLDFLRSPAAAEAKRRHGMVPA